MDCQNYAGSQALIDKRRKIKDQAGADFAMRVADEAWKGKSAGTGPIRSKPVPTPSSSSKRTAPSPMTASKSGRLSQAKPKKTQAEVEKDFADAFVKAFLYAGRFQSAPAIWCGPTASKVPNPLSQRCSLPKRASTLSAMPSKGSAPSFTPAHMAAACGNLEVLKGLGALDKSNLFLRDSNDWTPLRKFQL